MVYLPSAPGGGTAAAEREADSPRIRSEMLFISAKFTKGAKSRQGRPSERGNQRVQIVILHPGLPEAQTATTSALQKILIAVTSLAPVLYLATTQRRWYQRCSLPTTPTPPGVNILERGKHIEQIIPLVSSPVAIAFGPLSTRYLEE